MPQTRSPFFSLKCRVSAAGVAIIVFKKMSDCPIGLNCKDFECRRSYCQNLADPWPVPYFTYPGWLPGVSLLTTIPQFDYDCPNVEHLIIANEEYNRWVDNVRQELWLGGWWQAVDLPYELHLDGGLLVIHHLKLDEEVTFVSPWRLDLENKYNCSPTHWEEFMPPVPLDGYRTPFTSDYIEPDGFCRDWLLLWPSDFEWSDDE
jgi:hypothetical protein